MPRQPKARSSQPSLLEVASKTAPCVAAIRDAVRGWASSGYRGVTPTSKTLLNYWFRTDHRLPNGEKFAYYPFQREAIETLIYLYEVARVRRHAHLISCSPGAKKSSMFLVLHLSGIVTVRGMVPTFGISWPAVGFKSVRPGRSFRSG